MRNEPESVKQIVDGIIKRLREVTPATQILHCNSCHHEWAACLGTICDWCGGNGR